MRPILSAIGTPTYQLAKFLVPLLDRITKNDYSIKDSFTFAKEISGLANDGFYMASFDVESLFTNIPLEETVTLCSDDLFTDQDVIFDENSRSNLSAPEFKLLLSTAVTDVPFIFNGKYYKQIDGVAMGNPLGPTLANAFLAKNEKNLVR